jgi:hypothetical protein
MGRDGFFDFVLDASGLVFTTVRRFCRFAGAQGIAARDASGQRAVCKFAFGPLLRAIWEQLSAWAYRDH